MRPHLNLRALCAMAALGALCSAISLAVLPGTAQSDDTTGTPSAHAAVAADITPGKSRLNVLAGRRAAVNGRVRSGLAGRRALLQRHSGHGWSTIDRATTRAGGAFGFAFRPQRTGSAQLRVLVDAARREIGRLNVYRHAAVSWYGPGLYGNKLSCGGRLTPGHPGRRPQDAAVRGARDPAQGRPRAPRARRRPRPVRRRPRVRPDLRDARTPALPRRRVAARRELSGAPPGRHGRGVRSGG